MKYQKLVLSLLLLAISVFAFSSISNFTQMTSAQTNRTQISTKQKSVRQSPRIKQTIKGAEQPNQIPDSVAYELFLHTVAEGNTRGLVKRAGFNDEDVETIMSEAYSLNEILEGSDRNVFEFKKNKASLSQAEILKELSHAQQRKDELVARTVNRFLSQDLQEEGMNKLRNFITKEVKRNIQKILLKDSSQINEFAFNKSFVKSFASRQSSGG